MSPDTIEAVRCALMTVCETGGTMDELALVEQADMISELTLKLAELRKLGMALCKNSWYHHGTKCVNDDDFNNFEVTLLQQKCGGSKPHDQHR